MVKVKKNIICTIGPSSSSLEVLRQMNDQGMGIIRLNFSHGDYKTHEKIVNHVLQLRKEGRDIALLQDLEGPRIRVEHIENGQKEIKVGDQFRFERYSKEKTISNGDIIYIDYTLSFLSIKKDMSLFIDDGRLQFVCIESHEDYIRVEALTDGVLKDRKGINIPNLLPEYGTITEKDLNDVKWGAQFPFDYIAMSFVRGVEDVRQMKSFLSQINCSSRIISKIEDRLGIGHVAQIAEESDMIMVARGDMGVSLPMYEVPFVQKKIIAHCNKVSLPVVTATQMLESMIVEERPTRAEVNDVANAILDGTDYVMLSGETAVGKHPVLVVKTMKKIVEFTRRYQHLEF